MNRVNNAKTVLITTNHPAPYMDKWFYAISSHYDLTVIYNSRFSSEKSWKNYEPYKGFYYEDMSFNGLKKCVKKQDLLIVGGWNNFPCFITILLSLFYGKKVGIFTDYPFHQKKIADIFKYIFLYRVIDYIFCASQSTKEYIIQKYNVPKNKVVFFPYAFDLPTKYTPFIDSGSSVVTFFVANNFIERKGYQVLFEAFKTLAKDSVNRLRYRFIIAGQGPLFQKYLTESRNINLDICLLGWISAEQYVNYMNNADVYIHASIEEPFGIPPLDAMARKKVVIVSDGVKSTCNIIVNGCNGFLYSATDSQALVDIILEVEKCDKRSIGEEAYNSVKKYYSLERNLDAIDYCLK